MLKLKIFIWMIYVRRFVWKIQVPGMGLALNKTPSSQSWIGVLLNRIGHKCWQKLLTSFITFVPPCLELWHAIRQGSNFVSYVFSGVLPLDETQTFCTNCSPSRLAGVRAPCSRYESRNSNEPPRDSAVFLSFFTLATLRLCLTCRQRVELREARACSTKWCKSATAHRALSTAAVVALVIS